MCGIVGAASSVLSGDEKLIFGDLLTVSNLRGRWGAGTIVVKDGNSLHCVKTPQSGVHLLDMKAYGEHVWGKAPVNVLVGHTRYPTKGDTSIANVHPHKREFVTGVHNGTLARVAKQAVDKAVSDSALLYTEINDKGIHTALKQAQGAYCLVFVDHKTSTLNFIRNHERPLWFAKVRWAGAKTLYWASEKEMLEFVIKRGRIYGAEYVELPTNQLWSIPVRMSTKADFTIEEKVLSSSDSWPVFHRHGGAPFNGGTFRGGSHAVSGASKVSDSASNVGKTSYVWRDGHFVEKFPVAPTNPQVLLPPGPKKQNELQAAAAPRPDVEESLHGRVVHKQRETSARKISLGNSGSEFLKAMLSPAERAFNDSLEDVYPPKPSNESKTQRLAEPLVETLPGCWVTRALYLQILSEGCAWYGVEARETDKIHWVSKNQFISQEAAEDYECMYDLLAIYPNAPVIKDWLDGKISNNVPPENIARSKAEQNWDNIQAKGTMQ